MAVREIILKLCVLGDAGSRKQSLLKPVVYSMFDDKYITTIGTKVTKKSVPVDVTIAGAPTPIKCTLLIYDIIGQKQYSRLHPVYYQGALGGLVACALDDPATVASVPEWLRAFREVVGDVPVAVLVNAGSPESVEGADLGLVRALVGEGVPIHVTSAGTPARTDEALFEIAQRMSQAYLDRPEAREREERHERRRRFRWWRR